LSPSKNLRGESMKKNISLTFKLLLLLVLLLPAGRAFAALDVSMSTESGYPNPIVPGEITAFRITLQNSNSASSVTGTAFTNTMPVAIEVAGGGLISYACFDADGAAVGTTGTLTATVGSNIISLGGAGGTIPQAGASSGRCDIIVEVTSIVQDGAHTNTIGVGAVTGTDSGAVSNGSSAQQSITVLNLNNPTISKSFNKTSVVQDDETVRLTLMIDNRANNNDDLPLNTVADNPAFGLQDILPVGLEVAAIPNVSISCTSGSTAANFTPNAADTTLTIIGGAIPADAACTFAVDLVGTSTGGNYSQGLTNTVDRNTQFANKRGLIPAANASDTLTVHSALQVSKTFSPTTIRDGEQATLTITLHNDSLLNSLTGVVLTENNIKTSGSGAGTLAIDSIGLSGCGTADVATINSGEGFALGGVTPGTISTNSSCVLTINYTPALAVAGDVETFTASIAQGAVTNSEGAISQPASHSVTVIDELTVSKSRYPSSVAPGNPVRYQVTVNNYSGGALSDVRITDTLPPDMLALDTPAPSMSGAGCAGVLVDNIAGPVPATTTPHFTFDMNTGSGANPSSCTVTFWAMLPVGAPVASTYVNQIGADGICNDHGTGGICNAGASSTTNLTVTAIAPVTVSKNFSPNSASEGTVSQLTVTFSNSSAQALSNVSFTDNLPLGSTGLQLQVADPAIASSTCSGAVLTANPGTSMVSMSGASIPARASGGTGSFGTCELKVNVIGAAGIYDNILPADAVTATQTMADGSTPGTSSPGPVQATLSYSSALGANKSFSPATIQSGGMSTVAIRLSNSGSGTLNNVSLTDPLPAGMTLANPANAYTTCGGTTTISAAPGAGSASLDGAVIPTSGQCEFLFDVTATGSGPWVNSIPAGDITATGGVQNISAVSATLTESSNFAITLTNNTAPNSLTAPGETSVLTLNLQNSGTLDLSGIRITDYFTDDGTAGGDATGMLIAVTPNVATTCSGGVVSAISDGSSLSLSGASLSAGASCAVTVNVTMRQIGTVQDRIPVGSISTDQGVSNTLETVTSLSTQASIGIAKQFIPDVVKPGERTRLRLTFINPLALPVASLFTTDSLPAGLTIPAGANPTSTCSGATVTAPTNDSVQVSNGNLPAASGGLSTSCVAEIDVVAAVEGTYTNIIAANSVTGSVGGSSVDNPSPASAVLQVRNPVSISKNFAPHSVSPGSTSTLTIILTNPGAIPLTAAAVTDNLPANIVVALTPNASTTCVGGVVLAPASATAIILSGAIIPAGSACQVQVDVLSNLPGSYTNIIPASSLSTAEGISNEEPASDVLQVSDPPTVSKQFSPPVIPVGDTSTLTIVIGNSNTVELTTTASFDDVLPTAPGAIVVAATPNASTTCTGTLVAGAGATLVRLNSGATIPVGGCNISVDVTGNTPGTHFNSIPSSALQTNLGNNLQAANASLEISTLGYVAGRVFQDNSVVPNGSYESGTDTPLAGETINLRNGSDAIIATIITDVLGNYLFTGLSSGSYSVEQPNQPSGTVNGITMAGAIVGVGGGVAGTPTGLATTPSRINGIVLGGGAQVDGAPDNNFAEVKLSSISGTVFIDQNNNGVKNGVDTSLVAVSIVLLNNLSVQLSSTLTDVDGNYSFANLVPGTYSVQEPNQPTGTSNGITTAGAVGNGGAVGTATVVTTTPSLISNILLPPNTEAAGNNFAELPNSRRISGTLFLDYDDSGTINGSDHGIGSQTIILSGTDVNGNPVSITTTTANDGSYIFTSLPEGTYTLDQPAQPTGTTNGTTTAGSTGGSASAPTANSSRIANIGLTGSNFVSGGNNFAEIPGAAVDLAIAKTHSPASLGEGSSTGFYTLTPSNIGTLDTSGTITIVDTLPMGITSVSMPHSSDWSCNGSGQVITCTSNSIIAAGTTGTAIVLRVAVADGLAGQLLTNTAVIAGGDEPPGFDGNNSATDPTAISQSASVEGNVWRDNNHDRVMDIGEPKVPNWIVELILQNTTVASTITDSIGAYTIAGIAPGPGYQILFRDPASGAIYGRPVPNESNSGFTNGVVSSSNPAGADNSTGILRDLTLLAGTNTVEHSLPLDPSGVVYDSITRNPVAGAVVTISCSDPTFNPAILPVFVVIGSTKRSL